MRQRILVVTVGLLLFAAKTSAITIVGNYIGGVQQGPSVGGGNIVDIFDAAASTWESAIQDPFELTIDYGWGTEPGGYHYLLQQGGAINRETHGLILVEPQIFAPGHFATLFMDATPMLNEEFKPEVCTERDLGGGMLSVSRYLDASSAAPDGTWIDHCN